MKISPAAIKISLGICDFLDALDNAINALDRLKYKSVVLAGIKSLFEGKL